MSVAVTLVLGQNDYGPRAGNTRAAETVTDRHLPVRKMGEVAVPILHTLWAETQEVCL